METFKPVQVMMERQNRVVVTDAQTLLSGKVYVGADNHAPIIEKFKAMGWTPPSKVRIVCADK